MILRLRYLVPVVAAAGLVVACSGTPTAPSVSFTAPLGVGPASGANFKYTDQPITLTITNVTKTGSATVTYNVTVATDAAFSAVAYSQTGLAEDPSGKTSVQVTTLAGAKTYYWRWQAVVDGVTGQPSATQSFYVGPQVAIKAPAPGEPSANSTQYTPRPTFTVTDAAYTGTPGGPLYYEFQVSASAAFGTLAASATVQETSGTTSWTPSADLPIGSLFWRVRATDPADSVNSDFTSAISFTRAQGLDLSQVVYLLGPNISSWPQTAHITDATHSGDQLCVYSTGDENWPSTDFFGDPTTQVYANQWMFVQISGVWYGGAGHWLRPGQDCKGEVDENFFIDAFSAEPFHSLVLHPGDQFAVAKTTPARAWPDMATLDQRSDVFFVIW